MRSLGTTSDGAQMWGPAFGASAAFLVEIGLADQCCHAHTTEESCSGQLCHARHVIRKFDHA